MGENKGMLILGGIVVFSITVLSLTTALTTKSTHQKRMELIEEKEALFDLQRHVDIEKTINDYRKFTDSLNKVINDELSK